jgi:hypothetical protein
LYDDFDIGSYVKNDNEWLDMIMIRRKLQRSTLCFYSDKVARKRWLKDRGYPQPTVYFTEYRDGLIHPSRSNNKEELANTILHILPTTHSYCAKPSHMSMTMGSWLVDIDPNDPYSKEPKFTKVAKRMKDEEKFDPRACADSLAEGLQRQAVQIESWALKNVRQGLVIEELFVNHVDRSLPPNEFCVFVIWGRVYIAQWNSVGDDGNGGDDRYLDGFIYRDGTSAKGCFYKQPRVPDWVPWSEMVDLAESLSTGKDLFRVDFLVGVPRYAPEGTKPQAVISESAIHPNTMFCNSFIADEMARLWVAGYKIGNYYTVPNPEIPPDFMSKADVEAFAYK